MTRAAVRLMRPAGYGRIVNVGSVSGPVVAFPNDVAYHAAKAGAVGLTRSVALDTAADGITINTVAPGWIDTGSPSAGELRHGRATPVGRSGTPDEIASLVAYLASRDASYLTGQLIVVDGGNSIVEAHG
jgi:3-oxoacyl-[acyl-carrier protein] reductase